MAIKRTSLEAELLPIHTKRHDAKRSRLSHSNDVDSETTTTTTRSDVSALRSSPSESESTGQSSLSSETEASDSEESSSSSSSDDEDSDASDPTSGLLEEQPDESMQGTGKDETESDEEFVTLGGAKKPSIDPQRLMEESKKLLERLRYIMPKLQKANEHLMGLDVKSRSLEEVEDGEEHIEMNLGLGVLEEQRDEDSAEDDEDDGEEGDVDVMRELLGSKGDGKFKAGIQEVEKMDDIARFESITAAIATCAKSEQ